MPGYKWNKLSQLLLLNLFLLTLSNHQRSADFAEDIAINQKVRFINHAGENCHASDVILGRANGVRQDLDLQGPATPTLELKHEEELLPVDVILWNKYRQLKWGDFRGLPDELEVNVDALSSCGLVLTPTVLSTRYLEFEVHCYFSPHDSWAKDWNVSKALLKHEQAHFDLGEIYARLLRMRLKEARFSKKNLDRQITRVYNSVFDEYNSMQRQYDKSTNHSQNPPAQEQWETLIEQRLVNSGKHADFVFQVPLY